MSQRRRSTKAQTRLETLEGRITPTVTMSNQVVGAQILVLIDSGALSQTGLTKGETHALKQFDHFENLHQYRKAEIFLNHHTRLEAWLEQDAANANGGGATPTTIQTPAVTSNSTTPPAQAGTGSTAQGGTGSTTTTTTDSGTTSQGGTQSPGSVPAGNTGSSAPIAYTLKSAVTSNTTSGTSLPDNEALTWQNVYQTYETQGMAGVLSQFPTLKKTSSGDSIDVTVIGTRSTPFTLKALGGNTLESEVTGLDSKISITDESAEFLWVDAVVPIVDLPALAQLSLVESVIVETPPSLK